MKKNLISVIITVYNCDIYLKECLDSVCNQTYKNIEIILVDDGSTDESASICDKYASIDTRIRVIHKKNEGVVIARQVGISKANGDYISVIDSDDYLELDMLELLLDSLIENDCDVSMCGRFEETKEYSTPVLHGITAGVYGKNELLEDVYPYMISNRDFFSWGLFPSMWDKLFKKELLFNHIMNVDPALPMGNDAAAVYPCLLNAKKISILDKCLYHYRQNDASISKHITNFSKTRQGFKLLFDSVNKLLGDNAYIYDCRDQWLEYVIFLMIAKFDCMEGTISNCGYLFPYPDISSGSKVIIYGMGTYGKRLYSYIERTGICHLVTGIDREYQSLRKSGLRVDSAVNLSKYDYDYIVIAVTYANTRDNILSFLDGKCDLKKVRFIDEKVLSLYVFMHFLNYHDEL